MKGWFLILKILLIVCFIHIIGSMYATYHTFKVYAYPNISAVSAAVVEVSSGRKLYEKNCQKKLGMASTTKIMTAIVAIENGNLNDVVKISNTASHIHGSSMWLKEGEEITLENLIYGLMLVSGNDAAIAIAEHISGSVDTFSVLMNQTAKKIGVKHTNFTNPHGLADEQHYTTAYDLAIITSYGLKIPKFSEIVKTKTKRIPWAGNNYQRVLNNHNKLLRMYSGCNGVKTGFTKKTGRCLVSAAIRNDMQIVAVTLNAHCDWDDHQNMLDYAFESYSLSKIADKDRKYGSIEVENGAAKSINLITDEDVYFPVANDEQKKIKITPHAPQKIEAPVKIGETIGYLSVSIDNIEYKLHKLKSQNDVPQRRITLNGSPNAVNTIKNTLKIWLKENF